MAISYLSSPYKSSVEPYHENVALIAKVGELKQNKYDSVLSTLFQKQNQLLNLDTSANDEATKQKDNYLKEADNQLNKLASSDLTVPDNISKVEGIFSPIVNNKSIMFAASVTQHAKNESKYFDDWKKDGKGLYNPLNESFFWEQYSKNKGMSLKDFEQHAVKPIATEYVDIVKTFKDYIKDMSPDITTVVDASGAMVFKKGTETLTPQEILQMLPSDAKIVSQAQINAHYDYKYVYPQELLGGQQQLMIDNQTKSEGIKQKLDEEIGFIQKNIDAVKNKTTLGMALIAKNMGDEEVTLANLQTNLSDYKKQLEDRKKLNTDYSNKINDFNTEYEFNNGNFNKVFSEDELESLKTNIWLSNTKNKFANAWAYEKVDVDISPNKFYELYMQDKYAKDQITLKADLDMKQKLFEQSLKDQEEGKIVRDAFQAIPGETPKDDNGIQSWAKINNETNNLIDKKATIVRQFQDSFTSIGLKTPSYEDIQKQSISYRNTYQDYLKNNKQPTDLIPNSNETYANYFQRNGRLKEYIAQADSVEAELNHKTDIKQEIQSRAKEIAYQQLPNGKFIPKDLQVAYYEKRYIPPIPGNIKSEGYYVNVSEAMSVPKDMSEKYLLNSLTEDDFKKLYTINKNNVGELSFDTFKKYLTSSINAKIKNSNIDETVRQSYFKQREDITKNYQTGYLSSDLILASEEGSQAQTDAVKLIKGDLTKYIQANARNIGIGDDYLTTSIQSTNYKLSQNKDGWQVNFDVTAKNKEGKEENIGNKTLPLQPEFVLRNKIDFKLKVNFIEQALNQKFQGNINNGGKYKGQLPSYKYNYLGTPFTFIMSAPGSYRLYDTNMKEITDRNGRSIPSVDAGIDLIEQMFITTTYDK